MYGRFPMTDVDGRFRTAAGRCPNGHSRPPYVFFQADSHLLMMAPYLVTRRSLRPWRTTSLVDVVDG